MTRNEYLKIRKMLQKTQPGNKSLFDFSLTVILFFLSFTPWMSSHIPWFFKLFSPFLCAVSMFRSFSLFHDGTHKLLHKNIFINDLLAVLISPFCLLPFDAWKFSHLKHHVWSGNIDKDPVMAFVNIYPKLNNQFKKILDLAWNNWIPVLSSIQHLVFWTLAAQVTAQTKNIKYYLSFFFPLIVWSLILALSGPELILGFILPSLFIYLLGTEAINLPHHLQLDHQHGETKFAAWEQYKTARSCIYPSFIARHVILNFNFHTEHHMFPDLPWHKLDSVHEITVDLIKSDYNSDKNFHWIIQARKLKMADVLGDKNLKMTSRLGEAS